MIKVAAVLLLAATLLLTSVVSSQPIVEPTSRNAYPAPLSTPYPGPLSTQVTTQVISWTAITPTFAPTEIP